MKMHNFNFSSKRWLLAVCLATGFHSLSHGQNGLDLKKVIDLALQHNLNLKIARNYHTVAQFNSAGGMAGELPSIGINATDNGTSSSGIQKYNTGSTLTQQGVLGNSLSGSIAASWVVFNGHKLQSGKKRLKIQEKQSEAQLNAEQLNLVASVILKYYDVIRQQNYLLIMKQLQDVAEKKMDIINKRKILGMVSATEILQVESDLNTAKLNVRGQEFNIRSSQSDLRLLLSADPEMEIQIHDSIQIDKSLNYPDLKKRLNLSPAIDVASLQVSINELLLKEASSTQYPSLKLNAAYSFTQNENSSGYNLYNQNYGPGAGLSLQFPVFNGNIYHNQRKIARLNLQSAQLAKENIYNNLLNALALKFDAYQSGLVQIELQKQNFLKAKELVGIVLENFRVSQATLLDLAAAQTTFENAAYQLLNLSYQTKVAETQLKLMTAQLP